MSFGGTPGEEVTLEALQILKTLRATSFLTSATSEEPWGQIIVCSPVSKSKKVLILPRSKSSPY